MIYFGTDGIRGIVGEDLTDEICFRCGNALASLKLKPVIIVGTDTRISKDFVLSSFLSGATMAGAEIIYVGIIPTPGISFLVQKHRADFGVMLTASHNPPNANGIKIFDSKGEKIGTNIQDEIERHFAKQKTVDVLSLGKILFRPKLVDEYIDFIVKNGTDLKNMKIVLDTSNGASFSLASKVFKKLGAKVVKIHSTKNGKFINQNCGALFPQKLAETVLREKADIGFAFDGDADRIVAVDELGHIVDGDQILLFLTRMYQRLGLLKSGAVVSTVQMNIAVEKELEKIGIKLIRTDVGDKNVTEQLEKKHLQIGGEQAGHIILFDYGKTGDGVFCAVIVSKFLAITREKFSQNLFFNLYKQYSKNIIVSDKYEIINSAKLKITISECETMLGGKGRIVARASGTEPIVRIMVETNDTKLAEEILDKIETAIKTFG